MNPLLTRAREFYEQRHAIFKRSFDEERDWYCEHGYCFITPHYILFAEQRDTHWFIQFAMGEASLIEFTRHVPFYLPYIAWSRDGGATTKYFRTDRLLKIINRKLEDYETSDA
jgi:hypothetical protein